MCRSQCRSHTCQRASSSFAMATRRPPRLPRTHRRHLDRQRGCRGKRRLPRQRHGFDVILRNGRSGSLAGTGQRSPREAPPSLSAEAGGCCARPRDLAELPAGAAPPDEGCWVGKRLPLPVPPSGLVAAGSGMPGTARSLGTNRQQQQQLQQTLPRQPQGWKGLCRRVGRGQGKRSLAGDGHSCRGTGGRGCAFGRGFHAQTRARGTGVPRGSR